MLHAKESSLLNGHECRYLCHSLKIFTGNDTCTYHKNLFKLEKYRWSIIWTTPKCGRIIISQTIHCSIQKPCNFSVRVRAPAEYTRWIIAISHQHRVICRAPAFRITDCHFRQISPSVYLLLNFPVNKKFQAFINVNSY